MDQFTTWRVAEKFFSGFFTEFFGFLFDSTSPCYLVFASLFPYSCALLLMLVVHAYALGVDLSVYCTSFTLVSHLDKLE